MGDRTGTASRDQRRDLVATADRYGLMHRKVELRVVGWLIRLSVNRPRSNCSRDRVKCAASKRMDGVKAQVGAATLFMRIDEGSEGDRE